MPKKSVPVCPFNNVRWFGFGQRTSQDCKIVYVDTYITVNESDLKDQQGLFHFQIRMETGYNDSGLPQVGDTLAICVKENKRKAWLKFEFTQIAKDQMCIAPDEWSGWAKLMQSCLDLKGRGDVSAKLLYP